MKEIFQTNDLIVPLLKFSNSCPIQIKITETDVVLKVGVRDWQWDRKDKHLVGCGTEVGS